MRRSFWVSLVLIICGAALLLWLGFWQVDRLGQKKALLAALDARITQSPSALPPKPEPVRDRYQPVILEGRFLDKHLRVLASRKDEGAVHRYIQAFETSAGQLLLMDRGYAPAEKNVHLKAQNAVVIGHLHWPQEVDMFTPEPQADGLWYARDADAMAKVLGTDPVMVVAKSVAPSHQEISEWEIDTSEIPNDHLNYAFTWFSLAGIWLIMGGAFLRQSYRKSKKSS